MWDAGQRWFSAFKQHPFYWNWSERGSCRAYGMCQQAAEQGSRSRADTWVWQTSCWQRKQKPGVCIFWRKLRQIHEHTQQDENGGLELSSPCYLGPAVWPRQVPSLHCPSFPFVHVCLAPLMLHVLWSENCLTQRHPSPPPVCNDDLSATVISSISGHANKEIFPETNSGYQLALVPSSLHWTASFVAIFSGYSGQWMCFLPCN